jgi:tetratricopeptide (TPR) repeat protein
MVGRSSAFQFKGQNRDLRAIGQTLNANYLIDGSVRREGDRVRITAQLVQADNGVSLWTESYDRQLTSVFATQEDIAQAIAGALRVPLGLGQGENLVAFRTGDLESYQQYLRARARYRALSAAETIAILEPVVARDPGFAPAWALLARAYSGVRGFDTGARAGLLDEEQRRVRQSLLEREERAAREAIRLDPRHAGGYTALASVQMYQGKNNWVTSDDLYKKALTLDPNDADTLLSYSLYLNSLGFLKQALRTAEQLRMIEPFVPAYNMLPAYFLYIDGQTEAAIPILEGVEAGGTLGYIRTVALSTAYASAGRYSEAATALLSLPAESPVSRASIEDAARLLRSAPASAPNPDALPALEGELRFVYGFIGAHDRAFDYADRSVELGAIGGTGMRGLWEPQFAPLRKTERFKALVRRTGLVDYWRARGWPDLCRPVGADDFTCD